VSRVRTCAVRPITGDAEAEDTEDTTDPAPLVSRRQRAHATLALVFARRHVRTKAD
jgi:hypothetical protein